MRPQLSDPDETAGEAKLHCRIYPAILVRAILDKNPKIKNGNEFFAKRAGFSSDMRVKSPSGFHNSRRH